jgi:protein-S-isoprenylcysteine O-methyltransferase Ste14
VAARAIIGFAVYLILVPALLLVAGGDARWPMGWAYAGLYVAAAGGSRLVSWKVSPDMLRERAAALQADEVPAWDRRLVFIAALMGPLSAVLVAGLDHRFGWPPPIAYPLQLVGLVLLALGYAIGVWAMLVNRFFSSFVRVQSDRGHHVIAGGPYAFVRHPAYAGGILSSVAAPLMLDAVWAWLPVAFIVAALVLRTDLEDRLLQDRLSGYAEYASKVRYRLIPAGW